MDEEREDGGPTSKTTLSGEHGRRSKAKSRLNRDKEEKGIVAGQHLGTSASGGGPSAGLKLETFAANNPFLLHVVVHVLEGVKAKVPSPPIHSQPWLR
ncbi:unnamed protein product [Boreogadus saida]